MGLTLWANELHWGRPFGADFSPPNGRGLTPTVTKVALRCSALAYAFAACGLRPLQKQASGLVDPSVARTLHTAGAIASA